MKIDCEEKTEKLIVTKEEKSIILFVCTGNTCRSPMAEASFNEFWADETKTAASAGVFASGEPVTKNAVLALKKIGVENFQHVSQNINREMCEKACKIVCLSKNHAMTLFMNYPEYSSKITAFPKDVPDPFGGDEKEYLHALKMILWNLETMFGAPLKPFKAL